MYRTCNFDLVVSINILIIIDVVLAAAIPACGLVRLALEHRANRVPWILVHLLLSRDPWVTLWPSWEQQPFAKVISNLAHLCPFLTPLSQRQGYPLSYIQCPSELGGS